MADEQAAPEPIRPRITIEFEGPQSDQCRLVATAISKGQRMIAARLVDQWDLDMHQAEIAAALQQQAQVASLARHIDPRARARQ